MILNIPEAIKTLYPIRRHKRPSGPGNAYFRGDGFDETRKQEAAQKRERKAQRRLNVAARENT